MTITDATELRLRTTSEQILEWEVLQLRVDLGDLTAGLEAMQLLKL